MSDQDKRAAAAKAVRAWHEWMNSDNMDEPEQDSMSILEFHSAVILAALEQPQPPTDTLPVKDREPAPPNSLPSYEECSLRVENSDYVEKRIAEGGHGYEEAGLYANQLHRFIHEYDDADHYRSAWFLHRLELLVNELRAEAKQSPEPDAGIRAALVAADEEMKYFDEDAACDHSVGICWCKYLRVREQMRAALSSAPEPLPSNWRPIESVPKNGTHVLVADLKAKDGFGYIDGKPMYWADVAHWADNGLYSSWFGMVAECDERAITWCTHWMPLPAPETGDNQLPTPDEGNGVRVGRAIPEPTRQSETVASNPVESDGCDLGPVRCGFCEGLCNDDSLGNRTCCEHGRSWDLANRPQPETSKSIGFGIPVLADMVRERIAQGYDSDDAFNAVVRLAELRSEAIKQLRTALETSDGDRCRCGVRKDQHPNGTSRECYALTGDGQ